MTSEQVRTASAQSALFAAMLRTALLPGTVCGLVAVVVLWASRGVSGALAAAGGVAVAVIFFASGLLVMKRVVDDNPMTLVTAALAVFLGQVIFLGLIILSLGRASWLDGVAFGVAILVVALAWQVLQIVAFSRARRLVYEPSAVQDTTGDATQDPTGPVQ